MTQDDTGSAPMLGSVANSRTMGGAVPLDGVTFRVRTHAAAAELARQMCDQMLRKIYYSDPDKPQDGWFIVSTEPFEEK